MTYKPCTLCPRQCGVDRTAGELGFCRCPGTALVAKSMLHKWEEPALAGSGGSGAIFFGGCTLGCRYCQNAAISGGPFCRCPGTALVAKSMLHKWEEPALAGSGGSGAIFFGGCTLGCRYCQNAAISGGPVGTAMDSRRLRQLMESLIAQGAENIDLVTPTHFLPTIVPALTPKLPVPVVYNCGGYERSQTLARLEGLVDIYLPDLKYADNALAASLSGAPDYFETACAAIREMVRQTGPVVWEGDKVIRGTIIRHLILPGAVENSLRVLDWIGQTFAPGQVLVSLMRQYTPMGGLAAPLDRRVTEEEYQAVLSWMFLNQLEGFTQ